MQSKAFSDGDNDNFNKERGTLKLEGSHTYCNVIQVTLQNATFCCVSHVALR
jgi:hypothetical protein